jgi:DNA-binding NarL/FixJ family response regulator
VRVVIGEDQVLMREGLRLVLERAGCTIEAATENAPDLLRRVRGLRPDLVISDIEMPPDHTDDGLRAVLQLRAERPDLPVIVLSQYMRRSYAQELLEAGEKGVGYLLKQRIADVDSFTADVRRVVAGQTVLDPVVVGAMMNRHRPDDPLSDLTPRQREVLALMAQGHSNAAIASQLQITEKVVVKHVSAVYDELGIGHSKDGHRRVLAVAQYLSR